MLMTKYIQHIHPLNGVSELYLEKIDSVGIYCGISE